MKTGFFRRTAVSNIKKNYRFFIPRMLTEAGLLACFYIAVTLLMDDRLAHVKGGAYIPTFMIIGTVVLALLSVVLMLYVNSFLMKQRKREFGLYNVLGMEKRHVCRVLLRETFISSAISVIAGECGGMLFYKLCSLLICRLLESEIVMGFYFIKPVNILVSAAFFMLVDFATFIFNAVDIARMKPVELLKSKACGEKEPKVKWPLLAAGVLALGGGYAISLATKRPLQALLLFFAAVVLVIIGTYFLFVSGSIFVLRTLKRNKNYYYQPRHMTAVSGLLYRMKQNAVGLASIAILATGVLVMISTTVSLYSGMTDVLKKNYPQDLILNAKVAADNESDYEDFPREVLEDAVRQSAEGLGMEVTEIVSRKHLTGYNWLDGGRVVYPMSEGSEEIYLHYMTAEVYSELTGESPSLSEDEVAVCRQTAVSSVWGNPFGDTLNILGHDFRIAGWLSTFPLENIASSDIDSYGIVVANDDVLEGINRLYTDGLGNRWGSFENDLAFSFADRKENSEIYPMLMEEIRERLHRYAWDTYGEENSFYVSTDNVWNARENMIGMYGTLLFLGILLGTVCLFATVLIIYYKQISEGYEDRERYDIMHKIGMSRGEIRKTINFQVLLVFFLPLAVAGIHMAFAFPILTRMMKVMMLSSTSQFAVCALITYAVFAAVYVCIYSATAKTYYKIVS